MDFSKFLLLSYEQFIIKCCSLSLFQTFNTGTKDIFPTKSVLVKLGFLRDEDFSAFSLQIQIAFHQKGVWTMP